MLEQREEEAKVEIVVREGELGETAAGSEARLLHLPQGGGDLRLAAEEKGPTAGVIRRFLRVGGGGLCSGGRAARSRCCRWRTCTTRTGGAPRART